MTSPIPLRERLAAALAEPGRCDHAGGESCDQWWRADAAMPAVRDWLRESAREELNAPETAHSRARWRLTRAEALHESADAIDKELNSDS